MIESLSLKKLMDMLKSASPRIIGLDIGTRAVKIVEINKSQKQLELSFAGRCPLSDGAIVEKTIVRQDEVSEAILSLFENSRSRTRNVGMSLAGKSVIVKQATMTAMADHELEKLISVEAESYIPYSMDEVNLDFFIVGETPDKPGFVDVVLVGVRKDFMSSYTDLVGSLDLVPTVVDVDCFALEVMYDHCYPDVEDETVALINVGAAITNVNILKANVSHFTRDLPIGGDLITRDISRFFNVDFVQAENMKFGANLGNISPNTLQSIFSRHVELFVSELKRTLEFFSTNLERDRVTSIFLSGGASATYGFDSTLEAETGIPVHMVDPFRLLAVDPKVFDPNYLEQVGPSLAVAVGLALRYERDKAEA